MDLKHLIKSTNGIDIQDSAHVRVPAGEIRAALAEVGVMRRERDDLAVLVGAELAAYAMQREGVPRGWPTTLACRWTPVARPSKLGFSPTTCGPALSAMATRTHGARLWCSASRRTAGGCGRSSDE